MSTTQPTELSQGDITRETSSTPGTTSMPGIGNPRRASITCLTLAAQGMRVGLQLQINHSPGGYASANRAVGSHPMGGKRSTTTPGANASTNSAVGSHPMGGNRSTTAPGATPQTTERWDHAPRAEKNRQQQLNCSTELPPPVKHHGGEETDQPQPQGLRLRQLSGGIKPRRASITCLSVATQGMRVGLQLQINHSPGGYASAN